MQAPLGLAVIGGLVMSTFATLLVLPSIFAVVIGRKVAHSPSIYPDDRESRTYDPLLFASDGHRGHEVAPRRLRGPRIRSKADGIAGTNGGQCPRTGRLPRCTDLPGSCIDSAIR